MIKTEREFGHLCIKRGFSRLAPRYYARCIGDGIYQTIYTGFKKYIDPESPNYSPENRKSYYISIGLRSMYSHYPEEIFSPGKDTGGFRPADLLRKSKSRECFNGISEEYHIMEDVGFEILDSINTQASLLEWWSAVQTIDTGERIHDFQLVAPFLLCGRTNDAEFEICISYMHCMSALQSYYERVESGYFQRDSLYEQRVNERASNEMQLWHYLNGRNYTEINAYIKANYLRNISWVHKYGIPTHHHSPLNIINNELPSS